VTQRQSVSDRRTDVRNCINIALCIHDWMRTRDKNQSKTVIKLTREKNQQDYVVNHSISNWLWGVPRKSWSVNALNAPQKPSFLVCLLFMLKIDVLISCNILQCIGRFIIWPWPKITFLLPNWNHSFMVLQFPRGVPETEDCYMIDTRLNQTCDSQKPSLR